MTRWSRKLYYQVVLHKPHLTASYPSVLARPPFTPVTQNPVVPQDGEDRVPRNARSTIVNQAVAGGPSDLSGAEVLRDASKLACPALPFPLHLESSEITPVSNSI